MVVESLSFWIFTVAACIPAFVYLLYLNNKSYWRKKGVPCPPSASIFWNNLPDVSKFDEPVNYVLKRWTKQYGSVYGMLEGWQKVWVIADYKMAHEMFVKKFEYFHGRKHNPLFDVDTMPRVHVFNARGARWKRLRNISSPSFNMNNLKRIYPVVNDTCVKLMKFIDRAHAKDAPFNIHPYYHELTMDIICRVAMGQTESKLFDNEYVEMVKDVFLHFGSSPFHKAAHIAPFLGLWIGKVGTLYNGLVGSPIAKMLNLLNKNVKDRRQKKLAGEHVEANTTHVDFIDLFLEAEDPSVKDGDFDKAGMKVSKNMTVEEVIGNCFVFLLAGFDTTANTLAITSWLLATHPEVQQRLVEEIEDTVGDEDVTFEKINELRYMDAVMKEALRMYPIAAFACGRECMVSTTLGDYKIEKGENINIDILTLHFNKEVWGDNADEFYPDRFFDMTPEQQMSFYPFGGGPRTCIGMRLAYLEEKLCLCTILQKYKFLAVAETEKQLKMVGRSVWNPESVTVKLQKK